jgi:hypothetical protein
VSELLAFGQIGFRHIVAWDAADHILFLLALSAIYRGRDWKAVVWVISAFTIGHSITLALAANGIVFASAKVIEFLIPLTIIATGLENLISGERILSPGRARIRPWLAGLFGLVHGAGFAGYLRELFVEGVAAPLLGFNIGIEVGQLLVLVVAAVVLAGVDRLLESIPRLAASRRAFEVRLVGVSAVVTAMACVWAVERLPW